MPLARCALPVAVLLAASVASANPVQWVNLPGPIESRGLLGSANNAVVSTPVLPAAGPWRYLTISGTLNKVANNTQAREACIEVTTPNGDKFIIKPFTSGLFSSTIAVPAGAATTPLFYTFGTGACSLRFFELYADSASGPDATWTNLQITLHDASGNDPLPFSQDLFPNATDPDVQGWSDYIYASNDSTHSYMFSHSRIVTKLHAKGYGTAVCGWAANSPVSPLSVVRYDITAPRADGNGTVTWSYAPFGTDDASSSNFDGVVNTPVPVRTGQGFPWTFRAYSANAPAATGNIIASVWINVQPIAADPPAAADIGTIRSQPQLGPVETTPAWSQVVSHAANEVKWFTFSTAHPCDPAGPYWLDIHTQIPPGSAITDHEIAVFSGTGDRVASDDDDGSEHRSLLTFGQTSPVRAAIAPVISPAPRDGHDGALAAGQHYLAVTEFDATFGDTNWFAVSTGTHVGQIGIEIRTNLPATCGPADMGSSGGLPGADGVLDNNDFIAFINLFFAQSPVADLGTAGGLLGADGLLDNNDFIAFINLFFAGC